MTKAASSIFRFALMLALGACASPKSELAPIALSPADASALAGRSATNSVYQSPDFIAESAGQGTPGIAGHAMMVGERNGILIDNKIGDPAPVIARNLGLMLAKQYGLRFSAAPRSAFASAEVTDIAASNPDAEILVDVQTLQWGLLNARSDLDAYRVKYEVRMRLVDNIDGRLLAQETCTHLKDEEDGAAAPSYEDLAANGAAGLKQELLDAALFCTRRFMGVLFQG